MPGLVAVTAAKAADGDLLRWARHAASLIFSATAEARLLLGLALQDGLESGGVEVRVDRVLEESSQDVRVERLDLNELPIPLPEAPRARVRDSRDALGQAGLLTDSTVIENTAPMDHGIFGGGMWTIKDSTIQP